ncbi:hypothetical protein BH10PSE19_BH10PSE19_14170 [soil metagenome]
MCNIILAALAIGVALVLAALAVVLPPEKINFLLVISRFFEVMLPILGVGALIKYLLQGCCTTGCNCGNKNCNCNNYK